MQQSSGKSLKILLVYPLKFDKLNSRNIDLIQFPNKLNDLIFAESFLPGGFFEGTPDGVATGNAFDALL